MCLATLKILLVDDTADMREMLVVALRRKGYEVDDAPNGQAALQMVQEANCSQDYYDAVLLDYAMPGMDGLTAALKIREARPEGRPEMKIGFITSHVDLELAQPILAKLNARQWNKLELTQMIDSLDEWLGRPTCASGYPAASGS